MAKANLFTTSEPGVHLVSGGGHDGVNNASDGRRITPHPTAASEFVERIAGVALGVHRLEHLAAQVGALGAHANLLGPHDRLRNAVASGKNLQ